jgi:pyridoxal phosphate enzyme (YggS family)
VNVNDVRNILRSRLGEVEERLTAAAERSGRRREDVTLVAVTKTVSAEVAALLPQLGVGDLGENRPQELWRKASVVPDVRWHLIGHLQRNKVAQTLPLVHLVHSADSERLLRALDEEAGRRGQPARVLLEFNVSGEASKSGFAPDPTLLPGLADLLSGLAHVRVEGLMTMAAFEEDPEKTRPTFVQLRVLRDLLRERVGSRHPLTELSMGMSNDYEVAVEAGATLVRIGTALFEGLE